MHNLVDNNEHVALGRAVLDAGNVHAWEEAFQCACACRHVEQGSLVDIPGSKYVCLRLPPPLPPPCQRGSYHSFCLPHAHSIVYPLQKVASKHYQPNGLPNLARMVLQPLIVSNAEREQKKTYYNQSYSACDSPAYQGADTSPFVLHISYDLDALSLRNVLSLQQTVPSIGFQLMPQEKQGEHVLVEHQCQNSSEPARSPSQV
mmetsp:Transcript_28442/g.42985  ORF Transcript_28442/g.42985 Transcript_28442/m.42985 type:complete len:203 (+) Transcript_28442:251-859(+)